MLLDCGCPTLLTNLPTAFIQRVYLMSITQAHSPHPPLRPGSAPWRADFLGPLKQASTSKFSKELSRPVVPASYALGTYSSRVILASGLVGVGGGHQGVWG